MGSNILVTAAGGLIQLNHGRPQPLQYVVNAAFLATLYSDYLEAADTPGWYCGPNFYSTDVLREFAKTQVCKTSDFYLLCVFGKRKLIIRLLMGSYAKHEGQITSINSFFSISLAD